MISVIDYGVGNLGSILNMFKKIGVPTQVTSRVADVAGATKLVLPGVGAFDSGMRKLEESGLVPVLNRRVLEARVPVLGICLGMQLLSSGSEEGQLPGLGWLDAETIRFDFGGGSAGLRIPHMGWNVLRVVQSHPMLAGLEHASRFYFVHSYHLRCRDRTDVIGETTYGAPFASVVGRRNVVGVQFHPEKSHRFGMQLLRNFAQWTPAAC
jgi:glutamine amidotransferase